MSIHEEINHTRHDNTAQKKIERKQSKGACLLRGRILFHQEMAPWHVAVERATRLEAVINVLTLWPARHGKGIRI